MKALSWLFPENAPKTGILKYIMNDNNPRKASVCVELRSMSGVDDSPQNVSKEL